MGVAGLWEVLRPAGETRSLTELAVMDGFIDNSSGQRGFRIGIDASIWFFHAAYGKEGENPELRTLFFRCCRLLQTPLLPLFVFDGPKRPAIKRGKRVGGNAHWLTTGMKNMIQAFGFEYRTAPGEAEAELAYLNRIGVIDAVLSDDVDNFLFGATMVIRNPSNTLSGNRSHPVKNAAGRDDGNHVLTYRSSDLSTNPSVQLTRSGTILIALLSGGDYIPAGLPGCGRAFATGLARAGFGDTLVDAVATMKGRELEKFLRRWREDIRTELRTNKSGLLPTKKPSLASSLPDTFPSLPVLLSYVSPITSETEHSEPLPVKWPHDPDPKQIAALCELYFEWGVKDVIVKRFRTVLWPGIVCRAVRRAVLEGDMTGDNACLPSKPAPSTSTSSSQPEPGQAFSLAFLVPLTAVQPPRSSSPIHNNGDTEDPHRPLLTNLLSSRTHASTNHTPEYRVCIDPTSLVRRAEAGVRGIRPPLESALLVTAVSSEEEEDGDEAMKSKKSGKRSTPVAPDTPLRIWIPACMLRAAASELVETYEVRETVKRTKKKAKASQRGPRAK
ncbi:PIN domain-like protein, partial [Phlebopus sp. FC_14]